MPLRRLDHVNLRTANLERMIDFYTRILGLSVGPRPDFAFPGAWLYCEGQAIVHVVGVDAPPAPYRRDQQLEHFAVSADDMPAFLAVLEAEGIPFRPVDLPGMPITQINLNDPDGNHLHVDFKH
ncbi:VOC family protein [Pacificispira sp.]|uniref:VOC family protein n=1 Tax=Pacificispira sp. TaxID=2888761 RepID=UPI003B52788A